MKQMFTCIMLILLSVSSSRAIGLQHGLFRSQSTQGDQWMGTAEITSEKYNITVYPDYLDVELEWVFTAGGTEPDSFKNALEIVGNLNLENNAAVVSMLVWYNGQILKGKLKTNGVARDQYEQVVERNADAPPPPRDPVLLEMIRDDNYDISIFPVTFGGERKIRIRYLIPGATVNGKVKMGYPHAFTQNATVEIRCGDGVDGYRIETSTIPEPMFTNVDFMPLSKVDYAFEPYGSIVPEKRISYIIPVMPYIPTGPRFYYADFSTETWSGTMLHASLPDAGSILLASSIKEDYVVIWRWNHPNIISAYTAQIVEQAKALRSFFTALNATSKRGALIISIQEGETVKFSLDNKGSIMFDEMLAYLNNLCALTVPETVTTGTITLTPSELSALAKAGVEEFKIVLQTALDMLDASDARKYILVLTAGSQILTGYDTVDATALVPSECNFKQFASVFTGGSSSFRSYTYLQRWPGVSLTQKTGNSDTSLHVFGYLTNGTVTDSFQILQASSSYYSYKISGDRDRFLYSDQPMEEKIIWKIFSGGEQIDQIEQTPAVIHCTDSMQFARVVGSLRSMMPLSKTMPSSIASTLGFIDMKYTLLALEEDLLDPVTAAQYESAGVPLLDKEDIYPATDEKPSIPVADWLLANPRETGSANAWIIPTMLEDKVGGVLEFTAFRTATNAGTPRWTNTVAQVITVDDAPSVTQGNDIVAARQEMHSTIHKDKIGIHTRNSILTLRVHNLSAADISSMEIALYDLKGRVIARWKLGDLWYGRSNIQLPLPKMKAGTYLIRCEKCSIAYSKTLIMH